MQVHEQRAEKLNLERFVYRLPSDGATVDRERSAIRSLWRSVRHDRANEVIDLSGGPRLISSGWAAWLLRGADQRRQVFLFLMPGDLILPAHLNIAKFELVSLTPLRTVCAEPLLDGNADKTPLAAAIIHDSARYYELLLLDHLTRLTSGCTTRSLVHLLIEFYSRSLQSGACIEGRFSMPIGQRVLASALGRSTVQISKIIKVLKDEGLLVVGYDWIEVPKPEKLRQIAGMTHSAMELWGPVKNPGTSPKAVAHRLRSTLSGHNHRPSPHCLPTNRPLSQRAYGPLGGPLAASRTSSPDQPIPLQPIARGGHRSRSDK